MTPRMEEALRSLIVSWHAQADAGPYRGLAEAAQDLADLLTHFAQHIEKHRTP